MRKLLLAWSARLSLLLVFCTVAMASFAAAVTVTYRGVKYKSNKKQTYLMVVSAPYSGLSRWYQVCMLSRLIKHCL